MSWAGPDTFPATSLADNLDKKLLVILRDGKKLVGTLRSFDQFVGTKTVEAECRQSRRRDLFLSAYGTYSGLLVFPNTNVVLERSIERIIVGELFCDRPLGLYVIRGENVVLIGELDPDKEELPSHMVRVSPADIMRAQKAERDATELKGTMRKRMEFLDLD